MMFGKLFRSHQSEALTVLSPVKGIFSPLSEFPDEVFASGVMGAGVMIAPEDGTILAPIDGKIEALMPSAHALGITATNGVQILIHVGKDTVELNGKYLTALVKNGQQVTAGTPLLNCDFGQIQAAGYPSEVAVVAVQQTQIKLVATLPTTSQAGQPLFDISMEVYQE